MEKSNRCHLGLNQVEESGKSNSEVDQEQRVLIVIRLKLEKNKRTFRKAKVLLDKKHKKIHL
jgi:hypothetical protein